jgi:hypothetical protein
MDETSAPPEQPDHVPRATSRRWLLAGGAAVLLGGGAGAIAELLPSDTSAALPPLPPAALVAASAAERQLIADLDATTGGSAPARRVIVQARADHAAHLRALTDLLARFRTTPSTPPTPRLCGTPRTLAQLRAAEQEASAAAAQRASTLRGGYAALLASVAACEATHAELLR